MTSVLLRRRPDEKGFFIEGPNGLGHRRLSVIDLESGRQPTFNEGRSKAICWSPGVSVSLGVISINKTLRLGEDKS